MSGQKQQQGGGQGKQKDVHYGFSGYGINSRHTLRRKWGSVSPRMTTNETNQRDTAEKAMEEIKCTFKQHLVTPTAGRKGGTEKR